MTNIPIAQSGMKYEFEVDDFFVFDNSITFTGHASSSHSQLFPAVAQIYVDGIDFGSVQITAGRMMAKSSQQAIVTYDQIDLSPARGKKIVLQCNFE